MAEKVVTRGPTKQRFMVGTNDRRLNRKMKKAKEVEAKAMEWRTRCERLAMGVRYIWTFSTRHISSRDVHNAVHNSFTFE